VHTVYTHPARSPPRESNEHVRDNSYTLDQGRWGLGTIRDFCCTNTWQSMSSRSARTDLAALTLPTDRLAAGPMRRTEHCLSEAGHL
jgi:hypothetical protein